MSVHLAHASTGPKLAGQSVGARALKQVLETIDADSCPYRFNFHMHTVYSDGQLHPEKLMEQAIAFGLQGLAITDHHTVGGYAVAKQWLEAWITEHPNTPVPRLWSGVEINANLLGTDVHILGYAFDTEDSRLQPYLQKKASTGHEYQAANVIAAIHQAGGLAVLAHPARYRCSATELIPEAARWGIDGVEAYYAYSNPNPWRPSPKQTQQVKQLGEIYGLLQTCGTDTHGSSLLQRL